MKPTKPNTYFFATRLGTEIRQLVKIIKHKGYPDGLAVAIWPGAVYPLSKWENWNGPIIEREDGSIGTDDS